MMYPHSMTALPVALIALLPVALSAASPKRGLCHVPSTKNPSDDTIWTSTPGSDLTWYYNYQHAPSNAYQNSKLQFVPMLWGASASDTGTPFLDTVTAQINAGANVSHVLSFNEPDGTSATGGSNVSPSLAAQTWKKQIEPLKQKFGVKLGGPAVTGGPSGFTWLESFFKECNGTCSVDFLPVHWYGNFEGLASHVGQVMGTYPNLTIWVTEWALPNSNLRDTQLNFNTSTEWFDRMQNITRYAYFGAFRSDVSNVGPNSAMLTEKGELTDIGGWYLGVAAKNIVPKGDAATIATFAGWGLVVLLTTFWLYM